MSVQAQPQGGGLRQFPILPLPLPLSLLLLLLLVPRLPPLSVRAPPEAQEELSFL